ncbi:MAG: cytochrome c3 family protein [Bdellovibrio sp.]|nr:cytochrome c3 family protein [Bdellovibrio sp.]
MKISLILFMGLCLSFQLFATQSYLSVFTASYPTVRGTQLESCATCHSPIKADFLNAYGLDLRDKGKKFNFKIIEGLDSDQDGKSNIDEIKVESYPGSQVGAAEYLIFTNKNGDVHFNHEMHVTSASYTVNGDCNKCHGVDMFPKYFDNNVPVKDKAHTICWRCHTESGNPNAPLRCEGCHNE